MKERIFSLPVIALGLILTACGYYWGVVIQHSKVVVLRIDNNTLGSNINVNAVVPQDGSVISNQPVPTTASATTVNPTIRVSNSIATPKANVVPVRTNTINKAPQVTSIPVTPTNVAPVVTSAPAPIPTTGVSVPK